MTTIGSITNSPNHAKEFDLLRGRRHQQEVVPNPFVGSTSYDNTFINVGALPKANIKARGSFLSVGKANE